VPPIPSRWSTAFQDFIDKCLEKETEQRYSASQLLLEHELLADIDLDACKHAWQQDYLAFNALTSSQ